MKLGNSTAAVLVLLFVTCSVYAVDPNQPANSYISTRFTSADGLPNNIVNDIVQSQDGFLWMTFGSTDLVRFDGKDFTKLPSVRAAAITLGPDGDPSNCSG